MRKPFTLIALLCSLSLFSQTEELIDSLRARLEMDIHDTDRIQTNIHLSWQLKHAYIDTSLLLIKQAITSSQSLDYQRGLAEALASQGAYMRLKGDLPAALISFTKALERYRLLKNTAGELSVIGNLGMIHMEQGRLSEALTYCLDALAKAELCGDDGVASFNASNIGNIYFDQGEFDKAEHYYLLSIKINEKVGNLNYAAGGIVNLAGLHYVKGERELALNKLKEALKIYRAIDHVDGVISCWSNLSGIYSEIGKLDSAIVFCKLGLQLAKEHGMSDLVATNRANIAHFLVLQGEFKAAKIEVLQVIQYGLKAHAMSNTADAYLLLSSIQEELGENHEAFASYKTYIIYSDSLNNQLNIKQQTRAEMKYEHDKQTIVDQQKWQEEQRKKDEANNRRNNLQYTMIFMLLLVVFGCITVLGFVRVAPKVAEGLIFFSFLILFEFLLVLADPTVEKWSEGAPGYKLLFNALLAGMIFPLHAWFERVLKSRIIKTKKNE